MKKFSELEVNEQVFFKGDKNPYIIKAKGGNFLIAVTQSGDSYTIIDVEKEICGPHDRVINIYDFSKQDDIDNLLVDLINQKYGIGISGRYGAKVSEVIDLRKTLSQQ